MPIKPSTSQNIKFSSTGILYWQNYTGTNKLNKRTDWHLQLMCIRFQFFFCAAWNVNNQGFPLFKSNLEFLSQSLYLFIFLISHPCCDCLSRYIHLVLWLLHRVKDEIMWLVTNKLKVMVTKLLNRDNDSRKN
jgi:hypothetical protein